MRKREVVFSDSHLGVGGGQLVMAELARECARRGHDVGVIMPGSSFAKLELPGQVRNYEDMSAFIGSRQFDDSVCRTVLVSNTNRAIVRDADMVKRLQKRGEQIASIAIVHNYPRGVARRYLVGRQLEKFDVAIGVEPGLLTISSKIETLAWLAPLRSSPVGPAVSPSSTVKAFGRPDKVKGFHLLPKVFLELERQGFRCEIALGESLDSGSRYERRLRKSLKRWLIEGRRDLNWIQPGDIVIVPSLSETTCLSAQEAVLRKAFVASTPVGVLPYLLPHSSSLRTTRAWDPGSFVETVRSFLNAEVKLAAEWAETSSRLIEERVGRFVYEFAELIEGID